MHRLKMRPMLLGASVVLIGLAAMLFSMFYSSQDAEASTVSGTWKRVGTAVTVKKAASGKEWVLTLTLDGGKSPLQKGDYVAVVGPTIPAGNEYPTKAWRVVTQKGNELRLTWDQNSKCDPVAPPAGGSAVAMSVWTGPCVKVVTGTGNAADLSGVSDLIVDGGVSTNDFFHCIFNTKIDNGGNIDNAAVCFDNTGALGTGAAAEPINDLPGEGPDGLTLVGPPPPPPYGLAPPAKGSGTYAGDDINSLTCFADVGSSLNIIASVEIIDAHLQLSTTGKLVGTTTLYTEESNAACNALAPVGPGAPPLGITIYPANDIAACPAGNCVQAPWRTANDADFDNDGCTDADELTAYKPGVPQKCGDDPWNPHDLTPPSVDASGTYSLSAPAARQDCNPALNGDPAVCDDGDGGEVTGDRTGGFYYDCQADINQSGKALTARVLCYIDFAGFAVNPQAAGGGANITCPPAPAENCGDGISGAPPPGTTVGTYPTNKRLLADVDDKHTVLTGEVDNAQNVMKLRGCFEDRDGEAVTGNVYVDAVINLHTGHGQVNLWTELSNGLTLANCLAGTPGAPPAQGIIPVHVVRQAAKATPPAGRDTDSDGCPNKRELSDTANMGGLRDPSNPYDYMNASKDGLNRVDDILAVVNQYFIDDPVGNPDLKSQTDRTAITGGNAWNLGPPNGQQRVDDILAAVKQYFHDC
jgi:hypothetical protein